MTSTQLTRISAPQLRRAARLREKIDALERELAKLLGGSPAASNRAGVRRKKMSVAARARISAAQKARWAKIKAAKK